MGGSEEMLVASSSAYGQDECSLLLVKNFCCGSNPLGEESKEIGR